MLANLSSPEHRFLEKLFTGLDAGKIRYAVMRNYESLPQGTGGSDLDILVHPADEAGARGAIAAAIEMAGGVVIGYAGKKDFFSVGILGRNGEGPVVWWGVLIDVFVDWRFASTAELVDVDLLNDRFALHNGIRVLPNEIAAVSAVLKTLLHRDKLSARYLAEVSNATLENWGGLWSDLSPIGKPAFQLLHEICLMHPESADVAPKSRSLRRLVLKEAFLRSPLAYVRNRLSHISFMAWRFMRPPGLVIAVLGTDGAGKSTLISAISPTLSAATHGAFVVKHLRPGLLPPLARLKGGTAQHEGPVTNPHASKPSGTPGSLFRIVYLMTDYVLGYWLAVRPKVAKSPAIVLFDRYAYDMALDPRRFRIGLPAWLVSWFTRFAPRPDIILCLNGDPDIIAARKRELPREEVKRQTEALRVFASLEPRAVLVSTDGTVEQARDSILAALWECCARRTKGCWQRGA